MWRYLWACRGMRGARRIRPSPWSSRTPKQQAVRKPTRSRVGRDPPVPLPEKDRGGQERHQRILDGLMRIFDEVKAIGARDFLAFGRSARPIPTEKRGARKGLEDGLAGGFCGAVPAASMHRLRCFFAWHRHFGRLISDYNTSMHFSAL